jgi:hypothetical protein
LWVAAAVIVAAESRRRWLVLGHPIATVFAVVATANHWWADGIVAGFLLAGAVLIDNAVRRGGGRARAARSAVADRDQVAGEIVGANDGLVPALPMSTSSGSRRSST